MTKFFPLYISRSDGRTEIQTRNGKQQNAPSKEQLDRTPDEKDMQDYYRKLDPQETKHMDWRRKLAGMLMREIGGPQNQEKATTCILHEFPEKYRLYEHIKSSAPAGDGAKSHRSKNHSGGGHDRQDAYLYGHPDGPRKRFRSPADFFPHLLWLATDEEGDPDNCSCKICCPEEIAADKPAKEKAATPAPTSRVAEAPAKSPANSKAVLAENVRQMSLNAASTTPKPSTPNPTAGLPRANPPVQQRTTLTPSPLPQPRSIDQQIDAQYNCFIFRAGELVWFSRGNAWGLGVIVRRWIQLELRSYMIQPLSHPYVHLGIVTIDDESFLRPWLAWSAPPCTTPYLVSHVMLYDQVDWHGLLSNKYGPGGDVEVDASILSAKSIDGSYTPFEPLRTMTIQNGFEERYFNGLYLGGEKIWAGEPVRLRIGSGRDIMVVTAILERRQPQATSSPLPGTVRATAYLIGDIYSFITRTSASRTQVPEIPNFAALPLRVREDLRWRNNLTLPTTASYGLWNLVSSQSRLEITDIKGRWYESSALFPILQQESDYRTAVAKGEMSDAGTWMNSRGDSSVALNRIHQRVEAFGSAVPQGTRIADGIDTPIPPPVQTTQQQQPALAGDVTMLDDYLNLDGMEADPLSGFTQGFGGAGWGT